MKKVLSVFLVATIILTTLPFNVMATEVSSSSHDELIALACEVFPEYTSSILGENISAYNLPQYDENEVIFSETRNISETEKLTYTQFASGRGIIISEESTAIELEETGSSQSSFAGGVDYTVSYKITPSNDPDDDFPGVFTIDNFKYRIIYSTYDLITSPGTANVNNENFCHKSLLTSVYQETPTTDAEISYRLTFLPYRAFGVVNSDAFSVDFTLRVSSDFLYVITH